MLIEFKDCGDICENDWKYGVVEDPRTYNILDIGEDDVIYINDNESPDVAEDDVTYGAVDVGEEAGTCGAVEVVKQSLPLRPLTHV